MKKTFLPVLMVVGMVALFAGSAQADSIMIPTSAFDMAQPDSDGNIQHYYAGTYLAQYSDNTYRYFYAPVYLPQGAYVTSVSVYFEDNSTTDVTVTLYRKNMYTGVLQTMCEWTSSGASASWQVHKIQPVSYWNINNTGYAYLVRVYFEGYSDYNDLRIHGVRVNYN